MKIYLMVILSLFVISITGLFLLIFKISPADFPVIAPVLFYLLLFLLSFSAFTLLGYLVRKISAPQINKYIQFNLSFRQGLLLAMFVCVSATFLHFKIFTWWLELGTLFLILFIEMIFVVKLDTEKK